MSCKCPAVPGHPCPLTGDECRARSWEQHALEAIQMPTGEYVDGVYRMPDQIERYIERLREAEEKTERLERAQSLIESVIEVAKLEIAKLELGPNDTLVVRLSEKDLREFPAAAIHSIGKLVAPAKVLFMDTRAELQVLKCAPDERVVEKQPRMPPERIIELP
jgi:hypothetical protein